MSRGSGRQGGLPDGWGQLLLLGAVVVGAFFEVSTPHRRGPLVDLFALAAVALAGTAATLWFAGTAAPARQQNRPEPGPPPGTAAAVHRHVTVPAAPQTPPAKRRPVLRERPTDRGVPRFGDGARAQGYPWLLPERTVQNGIAADEAKVGALSIRAASVVGPGHRCAPPADPRQDSYRIGRSKDSRYAIVAVADGLSSGAWSDAGATTASSQAVTLLREQIESVGFEGLDVKELYGRIAESVAAHAAGRGVTASDVATVLITAVIAEPDRDGVARAWIGWLGDSSAWTLEPHRPRWQFSCGEAKDRATAVVSNEVTGHLPNTPQLARDRCLELAAGAALALVTDGVGDAWADRAADVNKYFADSWRSPVPVTRFIADVGFDAPQCLDDRTAVVVWNGGRA